MSMREYGTFGRGLLIPEKCIESVVKKCTDFNEEEYGDNYKQFLNDTVYDSANFDGGHLIEFSECSGDFFDVDDKEYKMFEDDEVDEDWFFIIELDKYPSLFTQAYKDEDEIVEEFKSKVGKYFPEDFDYKKYLVSYHGTYWG